MTGQQSSMASMVSGMVLLAAATSMLIAASSQASNRLFEALSAGTGPDSGPAVRPADGAGWQSGGRLPAWIRTRKIAAPG